MSAVLKGVRVTDLGRYIAGPFCGSLRAENGADVVMSLIPLCRLRLI